MSRRFDSSDTKFDELSSDVNELKEQNKEVKNNLNEQNDKSVSYTHLDVYKRQDLCVPYFF